MGEDRNIPQAQSPAPAAGTEPDKDMSSESTEQSVDLNQAPAADTEQSAEAEQAPETDNGQLTDAASSGITSGSEMPRRKKKHRFSLLSFFLGMAAAVAVAVCAVFIYITLPGIGNTDNPLSPASLKKLSIITALIDQNSLDEGDGESLSDGMYSGVMETLGDKYAAYYTKDEMEEVQMSQAGKIRGIGITFSMDETTGYVRVNSVNKDSTAEKAGIQADDLITAIDGQDTSKLTSSKVKALIQSDDSDSVVLTVQRDGKTSDITVEKSYIDNTQVVVGGMLKDSDIGYIDITSFNSLTADQFSTIYDQLNKDGMKGLIIDLRNNLGGLVSACEGTLDLFMPKGTLVYEQDKTGGEKKRVCDGANAIQIPLVVLVNENTASASEIFTGAVQDNGVGTIVGTQTYGKGIEQKTWKLEDGSAVKMTTTHYYTPNHSDINGVGITPDVTVEYDKDADEDTQFNKAVEVMQEKLDEDS